MLLVRVGLRIDVAYDMEEHFFLAPWTNRFIFYKALHKWGPQNKHFTLNHSLKYFVSKKFTLHHKFVKIFFREATEGEPSTRTLTAEQHFMQHHDFIAR